MIRRVIRVCEKCDKFERYPNMCCLLESRQYYEGSDILLIPIDINRALPDNCRYKADHIVLAQEMSDVIDD